MVGRLALRAAACLLALQTALPVYAQSVEALPALKAAATISIDAEGIAHIRANNEHDLYFLQGWTHARERLFQMDYHRRVASGTVAELLGRAAIPTDVQLRTLGLRRGAQRSYAAASELTRNVLQAYAAGVNAWVARNPLPFEYTLLQLTQFTPWDPVDSLAIAKLIAWDNAFDLDVAPTLAFQAYAEAFGPQRAQALFFHDLWRSASIEPALATVPNVQEATATILAVQPEEPAPLAVSDQSKRLMRDYVERVKNLHPFRGIVSREARGSSNIWAISSRLTRDGRPLVANDPHITLSSPSLFYPIGLELNDEPVFGGSIAGAPGVVHGYNRYIAWGSTNHRMDVTDFFTEQVVSTPTGFASVHQGQFEPLTVIPQTYRFNKLDGAAPDTLGVEPPSAAVPPYTLVMPRRDGGPIVSLEPTTGKALSVQFVGFGPTQEIEAFLLINRARNLAQFKDALQRFDAGSQNFAYGDVEGNIAYFAAGELPVRSDLQQRVPGFPWFVRDGTSGAHEWLPVQNPQPHQATPFEILPFDEMPQIVNPPAAYFVNANHDPLGYTADNNPLNQLRPNGGISYFAYSYTTGLRAARIHARLRELLETGDGRISFEEMQLVQRDNVLHDALVLKPHITAAFERALTSPVAQLAELSRDAGVAAAVARLRAWDGSTPTHSAEASIYAAWRSRMIARVIDTPLGNLPKPDEQDSVTALRYMLDNFSNGEGASRIDFFAAPGIGSATDRRDLAVLASLKSGLELLAGLFPGRTMDRYHWGELQKVTLTHPIAALSVPPIPTDGGFQTVDPASFNVRATSRDHFIYSFGSGHRSVYELAADGNRAAAIWAGGTNGDPRSPDYTRFVSRWVGNETIPLLLGKEEVKASGATLQRLVPGSD